ncbi:GNAT family N-acetyltransferase [Actinoplanes palleronii]|uniref:N-acetyltransferase n=1 Tax=Actinoplanes palleronii TaxID=113570 RepID=A0ABQ4BH23_9ACTN|nr:GNAT family protein [Actinoplanes palleronii]GIE69962.1 N-acetyltransferase [Actinoplanes palleronii]
MELRAMRAGDAESLWRWNHDPEVMRFMVEGYPQTPETVTKFLTERPRNTYGDTLFGVESRKDGVLIGLISLHGAEPETGIAELDIYLGEKDYWGQGYATDAMRTACRYGFDRMRLHRIWLTVVVGNEAAHHIYQKIGFVDEGRLRQVSRRDGQWRDVHIMGLLDGELR